MQPHTLRHGTTVLGEESIMGKNAPSIRRRPQDAPADPSDIEEQMLNEKLPYYRWSKRPGDIDAAHHHAYDKVIHVLRGGISFGLSQEGTASVCLPAIDSICLPALFMMLSQASTAWCVWRGIGRYS